MKTTLLAALATATTLVGVLPATAQSGQDLFQQALVMERANGQLQDAISLYERVVEEFVSDRELVARALVQMGQCYEKLGIVDAREVYRRVIDDFPEQRAEVATAQQRLASLAQELAELRRQPTFTKIEIASKPRNGVLSPDGAKLAFVSEGGVWVVPLEGNVGPNIAGEPVRIADVPDAWDIGNLLSWSADGEWIAVNSWGDDKVSVYIIPATGGEPRAVDMPAHGGGGGTWGLRLGLSPDGQRLAFTAAKPGSPEPVTNVSLISTAGGDSEQLSSGRASMPAFSADGAFVAYVGYRERDDWQEDTGGPPYAGDLWVVPSEGGAPANLAKVRGRLRGPVWSPDGRFIAAHLQPGNDADSREVWVFPLSPDRSTAGQPTKIGLPRSSWNIVAGWTPDDELGVFIQSEEHNAVYTVPASGGKAVQITQGEGWPYYPRWSPDGERIYFRGWNEETPKITIVYVPAAGGDPVEVPVQPERWIMSRVPGGGLNVSPDGERLVIAGSQEPQDLAEGGGIWTIPVDGGRPTRLTSGGPVEAYPCWSPDGRSVAFTDWHALSEDEGFRAIHVVPAEGGEIRQVTAEEDSVDGGPIGGGAIAFTPDGEDIAYFSSGTIKSIPVEGGQPEVLVAEVNSSSHSQLAFSPDGSKIAHSSGGKIWITPLATGVPEELRTGLPVNARLSEFGWSPDGSKIAFMASMGGEPEFFLISDFLP